MDPESGAAAYMISGSLNGGSGSGIVTLEALLGLALSAVTLSLLLSDIIGILAVAASLTVFGWAVLAIEIYFLVSIVLYMITLCEDYTAYLNGDAEAGDRIIEEVMIFSASTLACICVLKILEAFGINVCEWINSKMYKPGTGGTGGAEGSTGDNTLGMENTGGEDAGSGTEGGSDVGADGGNTGESGSNSANDIFTAGKKVFDNFDINNAYVKPKHLSTTGGNGRKFTGASKAEAESILKDILSNGNIVSITDKGLTKAGNTSYEIIIDAGKIVGTKGETLVKIILSSDGGMLSAYPVGSR